MKPIKKHVCIVMLFASVGVCTAALAEMEDDPVLTKVMIGQLEIRAASGDNPLVWDDVQAWVGKDLNKLWLKTSGERIDSGIEELEIQLLYSRAVAAYWDLQVGWRSDLRPEPTRDWFALGFKGLAPYFFEIDAAVFIGESGHTAARLEGEYEFLFTQRLILAPNIEINWYGKDDVEVGIGSGLSDIAIGLRLRYEIRREFAPYIGLNWSKKFSNTENFARAAGQETDDFQWVIGLRAWF